MGKYCEQYGFNTARIRERLELLSLGASDHTYGRHLHDAVIAPGLEVITEAFYAEMLRHAAIRQYLDSPQLIAGLKLTQKKYLMGLGVGFDQESYFEERLRVGLAHARVGIPLSLYLCAYRLMTQLIQDSFSSALRGDAALSTALDVFLRKITTLDMSLALDTYYQTRMQDMQHSIDTLKQEEDQLRHLANTDTLTELANRAALQLALEKAMQNARQDQAPLWVVMADLDHFKRINDTHGHLVGDGVLREVASRLRAAVRDVDIVGRYGGEEFLVILSNSPPKIALEVAERIRARIGSTPVRVHHVSVDVTISIGLTEARAYDTVTNVVDRADHALYDAKEQGRNRVVRYMES